jgi:hypothetical protein
MALACQREEVADLHCFLHLVEARSPFSRSWNEILFLWTRIPFDTLSPT